VGDRRAAEEAGTEVTHMGCGHSRYSLSEEEAKARVCELLDELEKLLTENVGEITAAGMGLFHVRRAAELVGCSPEEPVIPREKELFRRGIIIE